MLKDFLDMHGIVSQADFVEFGYGQVEPNHLSAQQTEQVYAQLPANPDIQVLEQGQFVKYDYANGEVNFTGVGEWMLVYNEIKLYREHQNDCEFAMLKDNYQARVYSPFGYALDKNNEPAVDEYADRQARFLNGVDSEGNNSITINGKTYDYDKVTAAKDPYEIFSTEDPMHFFGPYKEAKMPAGTTMVPRVFKTNVGDIYTTNTVRLNGADPERGMLLAPAEADGILEVAAAGATGMLWQVAKVYTMPDHQPGLKLVRVQ